MPKESMDCGLLLRLDIRTLEDLDFRAFFLILKSVSSDFIIIVK